ncbi:hypothetical protein BABINDRAFT_162806 [Babjeviella inositovora NRRL Y-12698]|uniref:Uncharacterized protein n=1 Tax=Babjeviella inositovora NRRL Y-12698 TaxID=984486 RepID=A0A1E3QLM8_9ASCO|nr:uncharacterized protein BABINDRAFT_162806 [Babjeviella inositovora NRRL Y-12698]ODQ78606.1 hypothetical protein BABINDRAFT_162806 [Babjeviella inositovora NRRL Y-12698]
MCKARPNALPTKFGGPTSKTGLKVSGSPHPTSLSKKFPLSRPTLKSITAAPQHIPYTVGQPQSHILHFRSKNSLLTKVDFINLLPSVEQSIYNTAELPNQRLEFEVVKARKPETLLFDNGYYLIFPSYEQACVFWSETFGKQLSGKEFRLVFASLSEHYQCIHSETLGEVLPVLQSYLPELPAYFSHSEWETGYHPQAPRLVVKRTQCALVRNLPFHVTADSIRNTLWDYDFYNTPRSLQSLLKGEKLTMEPTQHIFQHRKSNSNIWLLRFANHSNATRFVRSFNGTQWYANNNIALNNFFKLSGKRVSETGESVTEEYATEHDEGKYTEPLLCEILD